VATGCLLCRVPGKDRAHESPLVAKHAAAVVLDAVRLDEVGICAEPRAVLLVGGEAGETEQREGLIAGSLGRQEIAMVGAAMQVDQLDPPAEAFKRRSSQDRSHIDDAVITPA
jgi:hypothetical protein